eukprot:2545300-Amphidinium_carterae.2
MEDGWTCWTFAVLWRQTLLDLRRCRRSHASQVAANAEDALKTVHVAHLKFVYGCASWSIGYGLTEAMWDLGLGDIWQDMAMQSLLQDGLSYCLCLLGCGHKYFVLA